MEMNCFELMRNLSTPAPKIWHRLSADPMVVYKYDRHFRFMNLTEVEATWIKSNFLVVKDDDQFMQGLRSGLLFARTLSDNHRPQFLKKLPLWIKDQTQTKHPELRRFLHHYKKVQKYENQIYKKEYSKLKKDLEPIRVLRSKKIAMEKARIYERNYYRCMNAVSDPKQVTAEGAKRAKTVAMAITFGGGASAMITYAATNYDLPKDKAWWSEIAFVIVTSMAMGYVNARWILANPKLKMWTQRFPLVLGASAIEDIGVTALWTELLGTPPPGDEEIQALLKDEKFQALLQQMVAYFEKENLFQKHLSILQEWVKFYELNDDDSSENESAVQWEEDETLDLTGFDPAELDEEFTRDLIIGAMAEYEYHQDKGPLSLGSEDYDRYAFHRGLDLIYQPAFIIASMLMYNTMCVTPNPKLGVIKAIGLFMAINIAADALYFVGRRGLINQ